jgi:hypothetical protein
MRQPTTCKCCPSFRSPHLTAPHLLDHILGSTSSPDSSLADGSTTSSTCEPALVIEAAYTVKCRCPRHNNAFPTTTTLLAATGGGRRSADGGGAAQFPFSFTFPVLVLAPHGWINPMSPSVAGPPLDRRPGGGDVRSCLMPVVLDMAFACALFPQGYGVRQGQDLAAMLLQDEWHVRSV